MNQIQNKMMDLLSEIHDTCEKNNINYTLGADTAIMLNTFGELQPEMYQVSVYMTLNDFERFKAAVETDKCEDRVIEGMHNNPRFPGFFFKYVDKNTTMFSYAFGDTYICNGISVTIEILRKYKKDKYNKLRKREKGFALNSFKYKRWLSFHNKMTKFGMRLRMITGRKNLCQKLYRSFCKAYRVKDFETYFAYVNPIGFGMKKYPSYLYMNRQLIECNGRKFYIPTDIDKQYRIIKEKKIENYEYVPAASSNLFMASANVPYEESGIDIKRARKVSGKRQHIWLMDGVHGILPYIMDKDWNILKCVSARLDMKNKYMPLKAEILEAYRCEDIENLTLVFEELHDITRHFYKTTKMTIYFDREIFGVYTAWLEQTRRRRLAASLASRIPDEWR